MNERAVELYKQAVTFAYNTAGKDAGKGTVIESLTAGKFAELIVKECMKVVINGKYSATECERNTHRIAHNNARDEASSDIKKHFGVEE